MRKLNFNHILIVGLGLTGLSILKFLSKKNIKISVYDQNKSIDDLKKLSIGYDIESYFSGLIKNVKFESIDCVAVSPGINLDNKIKSELNNNNISIINDLYLFANQLNRKNLKLIGVTGTNGKTTTCLLLKFFLQNHGYKVEAVGNIGRPVLDILPIKDLEILIIELSSFQLEIVNELKFDVGITLNISEDHLDRYNSFQDYADAKKNLHTQSTKKIINYDDLTLQNWHDKDTISLTYEFKEGVSDYYINTNQKKNLIRDKKDFKYNVSATKLEGEHNIFNLMATIAAVRLINPNFDFDNISLKKFQAIPHRLEWVRNIKGINFYNDSKATNVASTIAAIRSFPNKKIHLIVGGDSKNQSLEPLENFLKKNVCSLALIGKDAKLFQEKFCHIDHLKMKIFKSMNCAVKFALSIAKQDHIVMLAPACASTDMYLNYIERGNDFKNNVMNLLQ